MGDVWDATTDVLAGRGRVLAPIALIAFLLPFAVQGAIRAYGGPSAGAAALGAVVAILVVPLIVWGLFTVVTVASDPAMTRGEAGRLAARRVPAGLLVALVAFAVVMIATLPIVGVLLASGFDFQAASAQAGSASPAKVAPGAALFCVLYALVLALVGLWIGARLFLVNAVVALERRGIGAFARSFALTRGLGWKLIGVNLLFTLVWGVAAFAARSVTFIVFRLLLGGNGFATATWFGSLADAAVTAAFIVVVGVFAARLHAAVATPATVEPRTASGPWG
ncbi:hypothetical protein [Sphingomonas sp.]|uniref:hypothetical protein n=1 Tax=Sphingomonas sp. TaxID=28214 RepID=UPI003B00C962